MTTITLKDYNRLIAQNKGKKNKFGAKGLWTCPVCWAATKKSDSMCHPGNKPVYFHSTGEYKYWMDLVMLEKAGKITDLERQPSFSLDVNDVHIGRYTADFMYIDEKGNELIVDFKGHDTDGSKIRRKLTYAIHGIEVILIRG